MTPDLELVRISHDDSFKVWSHGYPFRTVRWHFHPEYELHLVTSTHGNRYVGDHIAPFGPGDLVLIGPNLPHNWISDVRAGESVSERCHILQFTDAFITGCMACLPELRLLRPLLAASGRGLRFEPGVADRVAAPMRALLHATSLRRLALFMEIADIIVGAASTPLASIGYRPDATSFRSARRAVHRCR